MGSGRVQIADGSEGIGAVAVGTVVRFDNSQGYGFITPDDGGEDVFLHVSLFDEEAKPLVRSGLRVEFQAVKGDRGLKAIRASAVDSPAPGRVRPRDLAAFRGRALGTSEDDELCDVLSPAEFAQEVTDLLIDLLPDITGTQITRVRRRLITLAQAHGWVDSDQ
jgi:cold shock CspA family protein